MIDRYESFSAYITEIHSHLVKISSDEMKKYGLPGTSARLLLALLKKGGMTAAELAKESGKNKAEISRTLSDLEEKQLITRKDGPTNYRVMLELSEKGKQTAQRITAAAEYAVSNTGGKLSEEERSVMYRALEVITSNLRTISKSGIPND